MMPSDSLPIAVRTASPADAHLLADLGARTFQSAFGAQNDPDDMAAYLAEAFGPEVQAAELADPATTFLIAEIDGQPAGYARLRRGPAPDSIPGRRRIELARLYAEPHRIGRGVGSALMRAALELAADEGFDTLWLSTWDVNHQGIAFYEKWGLEVVGEQDFLVGTDVQHDLLFAKRVELP